MRKIREVLRLKFEAQLADREIARAVPTSRGTVQNYLERAQAAGVSWPLPEGMDEEKLEAWLFPKGEARPSHPQPDFDAIRDELLRHKGMTRMLAWEEHKRANPEGMQYSAFCDRYRAWAKTQDLVLRQPHDPGAAMYVDYAGETAEITNPETGEITRVKLFVAVLGHSNLTYAEATRGETTSDWLSGQVRALEYFGGVPKKIVPDNPKALVTRASRYDPDLNPSYQEFALHYSVAIVPARVRQPRDKAKVETAVQIAERWVLARLRNQVFFALSNLNGAISVLVEEMNEKPFQKLPGSRRSRFEENERSVLAATRKRGFLTASRERGPDRPLTRPQQGLFFCDAGLEFLGQVGDVSGIERRNGLEHLVDGAEKVRESPDRSERWLARTAMAVSDTRKDERGVDNA